MLHGLSHYAECQYYSGRDKSRVHRKLSDPTLYWITFVSAGKLYQIGLLFTHRKSDFGTISVMEQSCPVLILKMRHQLQLQLHFIELLVTIDWPAK